MSRPETNQVKLSTVTRPIVMAKPRTWWSNLERAALQASQCHSGKGTYGCGVYRPKVKVLKVPK